MQSQWAKTRCLKYSIKNVLQLKAESNYLLTEHNWKKTEWWQKCKQAGESVDVHVPGVNNIEKIWQICVLSGQI